MRIFLQLEHGNDIAHVELSAGAAADQQQCTHYAEWKTQEGKHLEPIKHIIETVSKVTSCEKSFKKLTIFISSSNKYRIYRLKLLIFSDPDSEPSIREEDSAAAALDARLSARLLCWIGIQWFALGSSHPSPAHAVDWRGWGFQSSLEFSISKRLPTLPIINFCVTTAANYGIQAFFLPIDRIKLSKESWGIDLEQY